MHHTEYLVVYYFWCLRVLLYMKKTAGVPEYRVAVLLQGPSLSKWKRKTEDSRLHALMSKMVYQIYPVRYRPLEANQFVLPSGRCVVWGLECNRMLLPAAAAGVSCCRAKGLFKFEALRRLAERRAACAWEVPGRLQKNTRKTAAVQITWYSSRVQQQQFATKLKERKEQKLGASSALRVAYSSSPIIQMQHQLLILCIARIRCLVLFGLPAWCVVATEKQECLLSKRLL